MTTEIYFRPHHFLCTLCFQGKGYSPAFIANYYAIIAALTNEQTKITVTNKTDSICEPCPHRTQYFCQSEDSISILDHAHATALGISPLQQLSWHEAKQIIKEKITLETFQHICASCSWQALGICENALTTFLNQEETVC